MKYYTIIGGVNGTGKSSFTGVLKTQTTNLGQIIDVDKITAQDNLTALKGGKIALEKIEYCLAKGLCFTQESTLAGHKTEVTAARAKELGYYIRLYYIALDTAEESIARIENRVRRGGHGIADDDVYRRFSGRWEAVSKILPYCDEAHFFDNNNGFVEVAEYKNGELIFKGDFRPDWISQLADYLA